MTTGGSTRFDLSVSTDVTKKCILPYDLQIGDCVQFKDSYISSNVQLWHWWGTTLGYRYEGCTEWLKLSQKWSSNYSLKAEFR